MTPLEISGDVLRSPTPTARKGDWWVLLVPPPAGAGGNRSQQSSSLDGPSSSRAARQKFRVQMFYLPPRAIVSCRARSQQLAGAQSGSRVLIRLDGLSWTV
ncbi:unnamed protein product [Lampetra planeri]